MIINLPEDVRHIINKLADEGYEAYAVGGCVRDSVIGRVPDDWTLQHRQGRKMLSAYSGVPLIQELSTEP